MKFFGYLLLLFLPFCALGQQRYIVFYADKGDAINACYGQPDRVLGKLAAERRKSAGIGFDFQDIPVSARYNELLREQGIRIVRSSKWLNAVLVETELPVAAIKKIAPQIVHIVAAGAAPSAKRSDKFREIPLVAPVDSQPQFKGAAIDYGFATAQNSLLGIDCLHDRGFAGKGVTVAFFDCGFPGVDTLGIYDSLRINNRIKGTFDFWGNTPGVYYKDPHGSKCASMVLANRPGRFVGGAPDANAIFAITDDAVTETPQDEFNYVAALEWADSLGADVVSASISYKDFDDPQYDYVYADMDGRTAITTIGCQIAARKGLLIVNGAGNSGHICAPCDADSILCVGGANPSRGYDNISSYGPSYDRRVKPDVSARTLGVYVIDERGTPQFLSYGGTSSATPQIAGLAVCLKQAHPAATNIQIIQAIRGSGHRYHSPDSLTGFGVPNACRADSLLSAALSVGSPQVRPEHTLRLFPNPASELLNIESDRKMAVVHIISLLGQRLQSSLPDARGGAIDVSALSAGTYILQVQYSDGAMQAMRFVRQ